MPTRLPGDIMKSAVATTWLRRPIISIDAAHYKNKKAL